MTTGEQQIYFVFFDLVNAYKNIPLGTNYNSMAYGGSMSHSQGLSNNPYPEPNQSNSSYCYFFKIHSNTVITFTYTTS